MPHDATTGLLTDFLLETTALVLSKAKIAIPSEDYSCNMHMIALVRVPQFEIAIDMRYTVNYSFMLQTLS